MGFRRENSPIARRPALLRWFGWPLAVIGTLASLCCLSTVTWTVSTALRYTEGRGRVVSAEVRGGPPYRLDVWHELDGRPGKRSNLTEMDTPEYNDRATADERVTGRYSVGSVHPCYFDANDPNADSVLVSNGIRLWQVLGTFAACLAVAGVGWWCVAKGTRFSALRSPPQT